MDSIHGHWSLMPKPFKWFIATVIVLISRKICQIVNLMSTMDYFIPKIHLQKICMTICVHFLQHYEFYKKFKGLLKSVVRIHFCIFFVVLRWYPKAVRKKSGCRESLWDQPIPTRSSSSYLGD